MRRDRNNLGVGHKTADDDPREGAYDIDKGNDRKKIGERASAQFCPLPRPVACSCVSGAVWLRYGAKNHRGAGPFTRDCEIRIHRHRSS